MATFKSGDRVRVVENRHFCYGKEATIWKIAVEDLVNFDCKIMPNKLCHFLDVDGVGRINSERDWIALLSEELAPLTPPSVDSWATEAVKRVTKPQPVLTVTKVPS